MSREGALWGEGYFDSYPDVRVSLSQMPARPSQQGARHLAASHLFLVADSLHAGPHPSAGCDEFCLRAAARTHLGNMRLGLGMQSDRPVSILGRVSHTFGSRAAVPFTR